MSKCTICNTPLRFGKRSGNTIDVERIRTGNMVCYGCHPHTSPIRNKPTKPPIDLTRNRKVRRGELMSLYDIHHLKIKCRRGVRLIKKLQRSKDIKERILKRRALSRKYITSGEVWCYVYGLLDSKGEVNYIGRSYTPRSRCSQHDRSVKSFKIIDKFKDVEQEWIQKYLDDGITLNNKEKPKTCELHNVGDIVEVNRK